MRQFTLTILGLIISTLSMGQQLITGTVSDYEKILPFATIKIKGTETGVLTDENGKFSIEANKGDRLLVSYVGLGNKEIVVTDDLYYDIQLGYDSLAEVIVVGQRIKKEKMSFNCHRYGWVEKQSCNAKGILIEDKLNEDIDTNIMKLFPNPSTNGFFNLSLNERFEEIDITVTSILGQTLVSKSYQSLNSVISVDLSSHPSGIYVINILANGKRLPPQKAIKS